MANIFVFFSSVRSTSTVCPAFWLKTPIMVLEVNFKELKTAKIEDIVGKITNKLPLEQKLRSFFETQLL